MLVAIALREIERYLASGPNSAEDSPAIRRVRAGALPEHSRYRDDGCDIHPHCLTCPLPRCRYDEPGGLRALLNEYRGQQMLAMRRQGHSVNALAQRFRLSRRTVFRILAKANGADTKH